MVARGAGVERPAGDTEAATAEDTGNYPQHTFPTFSCEASLRISLSQMASRVIPESVMLLSAYIRIDGPIKFKPPLVISPIQRPI